MVRGRAVTSPPKAKSATSRTPQFGHAGRTTWAGILDNRRVLRNTVADGANGPVASVARALRLLDELRDSEQSLGVNELARRIGVNASTASRLLATLESAGMVQRDEAQSPYRLGLALVTLADRVISRLDLQSLARPILVELEESTGETATLSLPGDREAITVDSVPSRSSVVSMARLGRPSISHATAVGKVMLAFGGGPLPRERDLVALTDNTITDRATLADEVAGARAGYGTVFGEREVDVNAIAAPVFDVRRTRRHPRAPGTGEPARGPGPTADGARREAAQLPPARSAAEKAGGAHRRSEAPRQGP